MTADMGCEGVRELAPELALGIADPLERDGALRHAAACRDCRALIFELSSIADEVLLAVPPQEPPAGFAARTLERMQLDRPKGSKRRTILAVAASFVLALAVGAGAVILATGSDRRLAAGYRSVLAQGQGSFFAAAPVRGPSGSVGTVFGYQGRPSWIFLTVEMPEETDYEAALVTIDGRWVPLGPVSLGGSDDGWGIEIPIDLTDVAQLRLTEAGSGEELVASFGAGDPWA